MPTLERVVRPRRDQQSNSEPEAPSRREAAEYPASDASKHSPLQSVSAEWPLSQNFVASSSRVPPCGAQSYRRAGRAVPLSHRRSTEQRCCFDGRSGSAERSLRQSVLDACGEHRSLCFAVGYQQTDCVHIAGGWDAPTSFQTNRETANSGYKCGAHSLPFRSNRL